MCIFFLFYLPEKAIFTKKKERKKETINIYCTNQNIYLFFPKMENMDIYAGATEETSVFDVETSEPSSTCLPKSCMMHVRNWLGRNKIKAC